MISPTQIKAIVPDQSSSGPILIKTLAGETTSPFGFSYIVPIPKEPPVLVIGMLETGKIELSWPNSNPAFQLQAASELETTWTLETSQILIDSGRRKIQFDATFPEKRFFRLISAP